MMFGLTECKRAAIMPVDGDEIRPGACGRALDGTEIFVIDPDGPLAPLRSPTEPARHKILDLVGDFALLGAYPQCEVIAIKSGHKLHCTAVRELVSSFSLARVRRMSRCFGPLASAVMKGRLICVSWVVESSILAFSAAS